MYRVAIIQNESEMLRSGYTNVILKLKAIPELSHYTFELFNVVNIRKLFQVGEYHLENFDSLIITTNATSDKTVLTTLREKKEIISNFISSGKGIFIASQKKLSTKNYQPDKDEGKTIFLPELYEFYTVERPKEEKDSGEGKISIYNNEENILLQFPKIITVERTTEHCKKNEFRQHFYRSRIIPKTNGAYQPIFVDTSYDNVNCRNLLMVNLVPQNRERIVISTIAIDWEFHEDLLTNLIIYITEGLPKVAFIDSAKKKQGDFDFLISSVKLSKIPYVVYDDIKNIKEELFNIHNSYIFSPKWEEADIGNFLKTINSHNNILHNKKSYIKVYYFKKINNFLTLTLYSNFSTIDLLIDNSILWIKSKFSGGMWEGSFWTSYDIITMLHDIGIDIKSYIIPILNDIKEHYKDYSYDGVLGATCGLFELIFLFNKHYPEELKKEGFTDNDVIEIFKWIFEKFDSQSLYDKQTMILTFNKYSKELFDNDNFIKYKEQYHKMFDYVSNWENTKEDQYAEIDICRNISLCIVYEKDNDINKLLSILAKKQEPSGRWTNTGRTAHVLIFLLKNYSYLINNFCIGVNIDDLIYNGIFYLRSKYDWKKTNWDDDIQATVRAIYAIGLYNKLFKYSTQDFFSILEIESDKIYSATVTHNVSESMRKLRHQLNEMLEQNELCANANVKSQKEIEELKKEIGEYEFFENFNIKEVKIAITIATITSSLLFIFIIYLVTKYHVNVIEEISKLDIISITVSVLCLVISIIVQNTIVKSDLIERKKIKQEKLIKKENKYG